MHLAKVFPARLFHASAGRLGGHGGRSTAAAIAAVLARRRRRRRHGAASSSSSSAPPAAAAAATAPPPIAPRKKRPDHPRHTPNDRQLAEAVAALRQCAADGNGDGDGDGGAAYRRATGRAVAALLDQSPDRDRAALWALRLLAALEPASGCVGRAPPLPFVRALLLCATDKGRRPPPPPPPQQRARSNNPPLAGRERAEALALAAALPRSLLRAGVEDARLVVPASAEAFLRALRWCRGDDGDDGKGEAPPQPSSPPPQPPPPPLAALAARWPAADHPLVGRAVVEFFEGVAEALAMQEGRRAEQRRWQRRRWQGQDDRRDGPSEPLAELIAAATAAARQATGAASFPPADAADGRKKQQRDAAAATDAASSTAAEPLPGASALLVAAAGAGVVAVAAGAMPSAAAAAGFLRALAPLVLETARRDAALAPEAALLGRAALEAARLALLMTEEEEEDAEDQQSGGGGGGGSGKRRRRWRADRPAQRAFGGEEDARAALEAAGIATSGEAGGTADAGAAVAPLLEAAAALVPATAAAVEAEAEAAAEEAERARRQEQQQQFADDGVWGLGGGFVSDAPPAKKGAAFAAVARKARGGGAPIPEAPGDGCPPWSAALRAACALRASSSSSASDAGLAPLEALRCLEALARLGWNPGEAFLDGALLPPLAQAFLRGSSKGDNGSASPPPPVLLTQELTAAHTVRALRALAELGHRPSDEWWLAAQAAPLDGLTAACKGAAAAAAAAAASPASPAPAAAAPGASKGFAPLASRAGAPSAVLEAVGAAASAAARLRLAPARPAWARGLLGAAAAAAASSRRAQASMPRGAPWSALDALGPMELSRLLTGIAWLERSNGWGSREVTGGGGGDEAAAASEAAAATETGLAFATPPPLLRSLLRYCAARGRQMGRHASNAVRALVVLQELSAEAQRAVASVGQGQEHEAVAAGAEAARLLSPDSPELLAARRGLVVETQWALSSMSPEGLAVLLNGAATLSPGRPLWEGGAGAGGAGGGQLERRGGGPLPPPPSSYERWKDAVLAVVEQRAAQCPVLPALDRDVYSSSSADGGGGVPEGEQRQQRRQQSGAHAPMTTPRQLALAAAGLARLGVRPPDAVLQRVLDAASVRPFGGATLGVLREALDALLEEAGGEEGGGGGQGSAATAAVAAAALAASEGSDDDAFAAFVDAQLAKVRQHDGAGGGGGGANGS